MNPRRLTYRVNPLARRWQHPLPGDRLVSTNGRARYRVIAVVGIRESPRFPGWARYRLTVVRDDAMPHPDDSGTRTLPLVWD